MHPFRFSWLALFDFYFIFLSSFIRNISQLVLFSKCAIYIHTFVHQLIPFQSGFANKKTQKNYFISFSLIVNCFFLCKWSVLRRIIAWACEYEFTFVSVSLSWLWLQSILLTIYILCKIYRHTASIHLRYA